MKLSCPGRARLLLAAAILTSCIGCDQATKRVATQVLQNTPPRSYLADTVRLQYALNPGGFLSLGGRLSPPARTWLFIGINLMIMVALSGFLLVKRDLTLLQFSSLTFILAGGIGNLIDRVANDGFVTDFLSIGAGPLRTGVFNVADVAVMSGAILSVWLLRKTGGAQHQQLPDS